MQKRRDVLETFGPYPCRSCSSKAIARRDDRMCVRSTRLQFQYGLDPTDPTGTDAGVPRHRGAARRRCGPHHQLRRVFWRCRHGYRTARQRPGSHRQTPAQKGNGACSDTIPSRVLGDDVHDEPELRRPGSRSSRRTCSRSSTRTAALGQLPRRAAVRFLHHVRQHARRSRVQLQQAWSFVNTPVADSQILEVPLAVAAGGRGHTGGDQFSGTDDPDFVSIQNWAQGVGDARLRERRSGQTVLQGQRSTDPDRARLLVRGVPQPDGDERLQAALGNAGLLFGDLAREELRA